MRYLFYCLVLLVFNSQLSVGQQPKKLNSSEIYEAIQKLNVLASVLYVAAHPDDENTRLISYMSNELKARTAYLSLTRGDGGQNLIGPELRELLGVIRTQELLAARRVDGGEQRFTRANDFGYSKHPDETLSIWDKDKVLADVVWAIRTFKPDIIINRFDHRTPGRTHGHHTTSAMLSLEAFDFSNNASKYSQQLKHTQIWQPKRLFFNTSWWFYGSREKFAEADKSNMLNFDIGVYYPHKGLSNNEVAALASSQHLCQGFGRLSQRGSQQEYIELIKGDDLDGNNPFAGIDTSWNRIEGGKAIGEILEPVEENFNFSNPSIHIPQLLNAYKLIQNLDDQHWRTIKTKAIKTIIEACTGLYLEASASIPTVAKGESVELKIEALNRSSIGMKLMSHNLTSATDFISKNIDLKPNQRINLEETISIPQRLNYTYPYWLEKKGTLGMYEVDNQKLIGEPETPRAINITFNIAFDDGTIIPFVKPVLYRYSKPDKGELYRPFEIIPPVSTTIKNKVIIFENDKQKEIQVLVKAGKDNLEGDIQMAHPDNWNIYPQKQKVSIANKGDIQKVVFTVIPPNNPDEGLITPIVTIDGIEYTKALVEIDYSHIPFQSIYLPSESKVVRLDIEKRGNAIGYIQGAGDAVPESLRQIGYNVTLIKPDQIAANTLSEFDAIVVGIRAYNVLDDLNFKQKHLFDFVKNGGNLIVQYNTSHRLKVDEIAPFELNLSRDRVTDETAKVSILNPEHPLLNFPNKITEKDFEGWVQERGLYFPKSWSEKFTPLFSINDKGETPKEGSLLIAKYGKGNYIYTGLSFFREFPAGVSGAYRLFTNMLSAGKETLPKQKIND